jgi:drug/metabolite transporter (DMT)-like permease
MKSHRLAWIAWAIVCIVWGTTYVAIKVALTTIPPFLMGGIRFLIAGCVLLAGVKLSGQRVPDRVAWPRLAVLGFFMLFMGNGGVVTGEQYLPSGLAAVLIATTPFWMTSIDAMMRDGTQLHARQWTGLLLGFAGIAYLVWPDITAGGGRGREFAIGVIALQLACAGWATGSAYTRRHVMPGDVLGSAAIQMISGGVYMTAAGTLLGEWSRLSFNATSTSAFLYLIVFGSLVAYSAFSYALQHLPLAIVSLYTYVNPVIAVALGTLLLGEPFGLRVVLAAVVIVAGIVIVGQPKRAG